jgi:hypothetical protein
MCHEIQFFLLFNNLPIVFIKIFKDLYQVNRYLWLRLLIQIKKSIKHQKIIFNMELSFGNQIFMKFVEKHNL